MLISDKVHFIFYFFPFIFKIKTILRDKQGQLHKIRGSIQEDLCNQTGSTLVHKAKVTTHKRVSQQLHNNSRGC